MVGSSLLASGVAFEMVSRSDSKVKAEIADWQDGYVFSIGVLPDGPAVSFMKQGDQIRYLGKGYKKPQLRFLFKSLDSALLVLTGRIGSHIASAQHRTIVHGNLAEAMQVSRVMNIVQTYLYPAFVLKKTMKRPAKLTSAQLLLKAWVIATLPVGMLANIGK